MEKRRKGFLHGHRSSDGYVQVILTLVIVLMTGAIGYGIYLLRSQEAHIASLSAKAENLDQRLTRNEKITDELTEKLREEKVNLTVPSVQRINNVFLVGKLTVEKYLTGVKVRGVIVNSSALEHDDAKFRMAIEGKLTEFTVKKVKAGSSKGFEAEIPDVPFEKATAAEIQFISSTASYFVD
ncbi:MAG: hypothetical protein ACM34I_11865 [bacterium]